MVCVSFVQAVNITLILFFSLVFIICQGCTKIRGQRCSCVFPNGSVIDLLQVASSHGPRWADLPGDDKQFNYSYNPCIDFKEGDSKDGCASGVAICQSEGSKDYNLGTEADANFMWDPKTNALWLQYSKGVRITYINLTCSSNNELRVIGEYPKSSQHYYMNLFSPCACPDGCVMDTGLSTGSVLVILFFVFIAIYFFGGMCYLKVVRGASGKELIPNYDFWLDFPLLVRDGVVYVCSGCRAETAYERI